MNFLRLLLLASIIFQPVAVPVSAACPAGPCSETSPSLSTDAFAADIELSHPLTAVSAIIAGACPLIPTFSDGKNTAAGNAVNGAGAIALPLQNVSGAQTPLRARICTCRAQGTPASYLSAAGPCGQSVFLFPPGGGFHAALLCFLATISAPVFPVQVTLHARAHNHPALRVGFFIAEATRA